MEQKPNICWTPRKAALVIIIFVAGAIAAIGISTLLLNIKQHKYEAAQYPLRVLNISDTELDPKVWGHDFPREYNTFKKTSVTSFKTSYGGSVPYSKLSRVPAMKRIWAGYAFAIDHNEERGHYYALTDQLQTQRVKVKKQPGACANCHAAEAPGLVSSMGWEEFNNTPYDTLKSKLHTGTSCADCHDPKTMDLRITRQAFKNAMTERGIDLSKATRQEMRTYVCAQCHVEYYFKGKNNVLTFPWKNGVNIDNIEKHYDNYKFSDWKHKESGADMIKIQHPEFEMWSSGLHARAGVSCADCHMPYIRDGAVKVSDHWLRSPLDNINQSCQTCHKADEVELKARVAQIQDRTAKLLRTTEAALVDAIDSIVAAKNAGASDKALERARHLHRRASLRWDFVSSENGTGFHSPQEAARVLADAINYARQAQLEAEKAKSSLVN